MTEAVRSTSRGDAFVGRAEELEELQRALTDSIAGDGRLFLLGGEAGIGKTRLTDELANRAAQAGARVLWGRCWESGGAPAFWPWVQILRSCRRDIDASVIDPLWRTYADDLAEMVPEMARQNDVAEPPRSADPEQARFRLFDATTAILRNVAQHIPLILILEDVHVADLPSLLLLRFLARDLRGARLMLLVTYRDREATLNPTINRTLAEIAREGVQLALNGFSRSDVAAYLRQTQTRAELLEPIYQVTEGNPFFVSEIVRMVARNADNDKVAVQVPEHVRAVIRQRLDLMSPQARQIMSLAAVVGREFDVPVLEALTETHAFAVRPSLEDAARAGVAQRVSNTLARWTFAHALLRDTLYDDMRGAERAACHRRIGAALEVFYAGDLQLHLSEVAHHFVLGADLESVDVAVDYAQRAGQRAQASLAYEEAVSHYERALQVLDLRRSAAPPRDTRRRIELMLAIGDASWGAGDFARARRSCAQAADVARALKQSEGGPLLAAAALGYGGRQQRAHLVYEQPVVDLLEEGLQLLPQDDSPLRARLLARLAYALYSRPGSYERRVELCQQAVSMARRLQDSPTLHWVYNDWRWALWGPDTIDERLQISTELVALATRAHDRERALNEHAWRLVDLLELGDVAAVEAEIDIYVRIANELRLPWYDWYVGRFRAMQALLEGRFAEAERIANDALAAVQRVPHQDLALAYGTQLLSLRTEQGRLDEMEAALQAMVAQYPGVAIWRSVIAHLHVEQGRLEAAEAELNRVAAHDFADLPRDYLRIPCLAYLADVCFALRDRRRAALLYDLLAPYANRCVVLGYGIACLGALGRQLGVLAATTEHFELAARHFEDALQLNQRLRARPALARTQLAYAEMLCRDPQGDTRRAAQLAGQAAETAAELGMLQVEARALKLGADLATAPAPTDMQPAPTPRAKRVAKPENAVFQRRGDVWTATFEGKDVQLKDLLGFNYVAHLLRYPEREFHVLDLVSVAATGRDEEVAAPTAALYGDAGEQLDPRARAEYRERLRELKEELGEAEQNNDLGRVELLRSEMDVLAQELTRASGLGGRSRRVGSVAERARVSVTKRIGIALRRIGEHHQGLAHYLSQTIKTGTFCSYTPDPRRRVDWSL